MVNDFLKDIIKSTGNEYASLVEDGVEAGDVESLLIQVHIFSTHYLAVVFTEDCQATSCSHWRENRPQGKPTFLWESLRTFSMQTPMQA